MIRRILDALRWLWFSQPEEPITEHVMSPWDLRRAIQDHEDAQLGVASSDWMRAKYMEPRRPRRGRRESKYMDPYTPEAAQ